MVAGGDAVDRLNHCQCRGQRILGLMRVGRMPTGRMDGYLKFANTSHHRAGRCQDMALRFHWGIVQGIDLADAKTVHHAFLHHDFAAATLFLSGLEQQHDLAGKVAGFRQIPGGPQQHSCMAIMAAGMHLAGHRRGMGGAGFLLDGQRIHVRAQPDPARTLALPPDHCHHTRFGNALVNFVNAKGFELLDNKARRLFAIEGKLGMGMQMASPPFHVGGKIGNTVHDGHAGSLRWIWLRP